MNKTYFAITQLIKSAITEQAVLLPDDFEWKTVVDMARFHKIEVLVYYGAFYSNITIPTEYENILKKSVFTQSSLDAQQGYEISKLCERLDKNGIAYLPLKGMLIKKHYPKPEMRYMSDADILIKEEEYSKIEHIMLKLGYSFKVESDHEYVWTKQTICVELHKKLIPSYNKDYYRYYGDGWQLAKLVDGKYVMSNEDFYIYLFTHLAKHYRDSGIGVKQFVDLWVYRKSVPLDEIYIDTELTRLQLFEFHENSKQMLEVWFEVAKPADITDYMTSFVFSSGVYGTQKTSEVSNVLRQIADMKSSKNIKLILYMRKIFLPYNYMKLRYPILKKCPILLPFMWLVRIFECVLFRSDKIKTNVKEVYMLSSEEIDAYENSLEYVGLKFDFKEKK